jgi:aspartyl/asparaginyl-tRNA synthetase
MFDVELAFIEDHHDVMDVQEESFRHTLKKVKEEAADELETLGVDLTVPEEDFPRIEFDRAREILEEEFDHVPDDDGDLHARVLIQTANKNCDLNAKEAPGCAYRIGTTVVHKKQSPPQTGRI